jgi:hypothetical protein
VVAVGLGFSVGRRWDSPPAPARAIDERATLSVLQSEQLAFLVTRRAVTQVVFEHRESDLLGEWRGVLWASVIRWGVDMTRIGPGDLTRRGDVLIVRLPQPDLLDFALVPGSVGYMGKATALPKLTDYCRGGYQRSLLEGRIRQRAMEFAAAQNLLPTREQIVAQLNGSSELLSSATGLQVRFE